MLPDCFTNNMGSFSNVRERKEEWKDVESGGGSMKVYLAPSKATQQYLSSAAEVLVPLTQ